MEGGRRAGRRPAHPDLHRSHGTPDDVPAAGVYTFVESPEGAADAALAAAGDKDVDVFSASIGQQLLAAGRVDEIHIHLAPVLLGTGTRLIDHLGGRHIRLRRIAASESELASHLRYAVVRDG